MSALLDLTHWIENTDGIPECVRSELHARILAVYKEGYADGHEVAIGEGSTQSNKSYSECSKANKDARGSGDKRQRLEVESSGREGDMEDNTVKGAEYMDTWIVATDSCIKLRCRRGHSQGQIGQEFDLGEVRTCDFYADGMLLIQLIHLWHIDSDKKLENQLRARLMSSDHKYTDDGRIWVPLFSYKRVAQSFGVYDPVERLVECAEGKKNLVEALAEAFATWDRKWTYTGLSIIKDEAN
ncbi:uncharacterized protein J3D65DRAFT_676089 [Phyllosticta citribraziliensis]|uniref:Uncharacterized protein n=1 Tax=Phyllosticta citribraziliensis TaxID=989973 RepID=A0ABR1M118_9PEZI